MAGVTTDGPATTVSRRKYHSVFIGSAPFPELAPLETSRSPFSPSPIFQIEETDLVGCPSTSESRGITRR